LINPHVQHLTSELLLALVNARHYSMLVRRCVYKGKIAFSLFPRKRKTTSLGKLLIGVDNIIMQRDSETIRLTH